MYHVQYHFSVSVLVIEKNKINDNMLMLRACTPHYLQICYISDRGSVSDISVCVSTCVVVIIIIIIIITTTTTHVYNNKK